MLAQTRLGRKNPEDERPGRSRGVHCCTFAGEHLETDAAVGQVMHGVDEVAQVSAQSVEFPYQDRVSLFGAPSGRQPTECRCIKVSPGVTIRGKACRDQLF